VLALKDSQRGNKSERVEVTLSAPVEYEDFFPRRTCGEIAYTDEEEGYCEEGEGRRCDFEGAGMWLELLSIFGVQGNGD
jgi:hypothetical protein